MDKVIIVGASGTIGRAVADFLEPSNDVIRVGHTQGDYTVDLVEKESIEKLIKGIRINAVSPIFVTETAKKTGMDIAGTMSAIETARAYQVCVGGDMTGQVLDVREYGKVEASGQ